MTLAYFVTYKNDYFCYNPPQRWGNWDFFLIDTLGRLEWNTEWTVFMYAYIYIYMIQFWIQ